MPPKICIKVRIPRPLDEPIIFFNLVVEQDETFSRVWQLVEERYRVNYKEGRKQ
jgi:hypothetical protein